MNNPIVDEVRKARTEILDSYDGNIDAMLLDMMKRQHEHGRQVVRLYPEASNEHVSHNPHKPL